MAVSGKTTKKQLQSEMQQYQNGAGNSQNAASYTAYKNANPNRVDYNQYDASDKKSSGSTGSNSGAYTGLAGVSQRTAQQTGNYQAGYKQGDAVTQAQNTLLQVQNSKPGEYKSQYGEQLNNILQQIFIFLKFFESGKAGHFHKHKLILF